MTQRARSEPENIGKGGEGFLNKPEQQIKRQRIQSTGKENQ